MTLYEQVFKCCSQAQNAKKNIADDNALTQSKVADLQLYSGLLPSSLLHRWQLLFQAFLSYIGGDESCWERFDSIRILFERPTIKGVDRIFHNRAHYTKVHESKNDDSSPAFAFSCKPRFETAPISSHWLLKSAGQIFFKLES